MFSSPLAAAYRRKAPAGEHYRERRTRRRLHQESIRPFRRAKAPCPDRTRCRRRPNAIGIFWKLTNEVECIGKKPLAITDALKSRRLLGVTNASSATL